MTIIPFRGIMQKMEKELRYFDFQGLEDKVHHLHKFEEILMFVAYAAVVYMAVSLFLIFDRQR